MPTNMTFRQLLQDDTYRVEMMKVLEVEKVQALTPREICITQALKAYIKLKGTSLPVLLDTRASVSAISKDLAQKFQLKMEANDGTRVSPLEEDTFINLTYQNFRNFVYSRRY